MRINNTMKLENTKEYKNNFLVAAGSSFSARTGGFLLPSTRQFQQKSAHNRAVMLIKQGTEHFLPFKVLPIRNLGWKWEVSHPTSFTSVALVSNSAAELQDIQYSISIFGYTYLTWTKCWIMCVRGKQCCLSYSKSKHTWLAAVGHGDSVFYLRKYLIHLH